MYAENVITAARKIANDIKASAMLILTETGESYDVIAGSESKIPVIVATANDATFRKILKDSDVVDLSKSDGRGKADTYAIKLLTRGSSKAGQMEDAIAAAMQKGVLKDDDLLVVVGSTLSGEADSMFLHRIDEEKMDYTIYDLIKSSGIKNEAFEAVINIALGIGREGREGRLIGTAFLIGDKAKVLKNSTQLILNPFEGHMIEERNITNPEIIETIKELAQLEGVFVISGNGVIEAAGRYLNVDTSNVDIPRGLGTRHAAVASMTVASSALGITVSQSGGVVRIFKNGEVVMKIEPQRKISLKIDGLKRDLK